MLTLVAILTLIGASVWVARAEAHRPGLHAAGTLEAPKLHWLVSARQETNRVARQKCIPRPYRSVRPASLVPEFVRSFYITVELARQAAYRLRDSECLPTTVTGIIRYVFGDYGSEAVSVAYCESRLSVFARNGQYLGLFQMGDYARSRYGHGWDAWTQSRAAYRYFVDAGKDWSPWQCRPGGGLAW